MTSTTTDVRSYRPGCVHIRPLTGADREGLADKFSHLSEHTRRRRFGGLATRLSERDLDRLTGIDHHRHEAPAAIEPASRRIVCVARYIAVPAVRGAAELAVEVDDAWQGCGIGRTLISELARRARRAGFTRRLAYVSNDNFPVLGWHAHAGAVAETHDDAALHSISLRRGESDQRAA